MSIELKPGMGIRALGQYTTTVEFMDKLALGSEPEGVTCVSYAAGSLVLNVQYPAKLQ